MSEPNTQFISYPWEVPANALVNNLKQPKHVLLV